MSIVVGAHTIRPPSYIHLDKNNQHGKYMSQLALGIPIRQKDSYPISLIICTVASAGDHFDRLPQ